MNILPMSSNESENNSPEKSVHRLADHLFRHESGKMVSILTGIYGAQRLQMAEDVVQEALIRALKTWPFYGTPDKPTAWLLRTAKNLAIDQLRREKNFHQKQPEILAEMESTQSEASPIADDEGGVNDDQLRLMFVCSHPGLPQEAQSALALKVLCGFSPAEIAKAFLISEAAVSKRLTRARQRLQNDRIPFEIPTGSALPERLEGVLKILYLLFNEGYKASHGEEVVRAELCAEAIRLGVLLAAHPAGNRPRTHALLALMSLTAARLPSRTDSEGNLLRLEDQNRDLWDANLIQLGIRHLAKSSGGGELGEYHLQAGIAACHTLAHSDAATDWTRILTMYDRLMEFHPSPVIALNRAVAVSKVHGPEEGIRALEQSKNRERLENYHLLHAVMGELELKRGRNEIAAEHFRRALDLSETRPERVLIAKRLEDCLT
ncbi:MAG: sigma-70 family RNA polymerase sigma factor [Armatimonadetes bacterium]|nr:sigma-70 family RNA polymerase sigma factor [Akkermansiaceae bacterium]